MSYILPFAFLATLLFMFSLLLGELLLKKFSKYSYNDIYGLPHFSSFIGIILIVSGFSLFYTGFKTINIFAVLLLIVYFINDYHKKSLSFKVDLKGVLSNTLTFLALFIVMSVFHLLAFKDNLDILYYGGMLSHGIYDTGVENFYGYYNQYLSPEIANSTTPYHYFEMWLTVLFKQFPINFSFLMVLKYLVYVFLETYIVFALYSLLKSLKFKINLLFYIPIILVTAFPLNLVLGVFNNSWHDFYFSFWHYPNFILYSFILINVLTLFLNNNFKSGLIIILLLPVISITTAPAILTTVFIVSVLFFYFKVFNFKELLFVSLSSVVLAILILLFYKITSSPIEAYIENDTPLLLRYKNAWKAVLYILGIVNVIIFIFLGILSFYNKKIKALDNSIFNKLLLICMLTVSSGVFLYQLAFYVENSYQFVYVGYSLVFLVFALLILKGFFSKSKLKYLSYLIVAFSAGHLFYNTPNFDFKDIRFSEFSHYEEALIERTKKTELILNQKRKVIVVLTEETLPYIRSFSYRVPMSGLFFLGDYKIITMVDEDILYTPVKGRKFDIGYDRAKIANSILPKEWLNLNNIDSIVAREKVMFIAIPKGNAIIRKTILTPVKDSLTISNYKLLILE